MILLIAYSAAARIIVTLRGGWRGRRGGRYSKARLATGASEKSRPFVRRDARL